jgi:uncharacterized membrane protein
MMKNMDKLVKSAMTAFLAMAATHAALAATAPAPNQSSEKCYGIVKAGLNDCATATSSCAGSASKDNQADAFILLPKGVCDKLVGGNLKAEGK